jgi:hypothetical protein
MDGCPVDLAMEFFQQVIQLLSEPPGSIIYHLVTLFALQVVFALSYSQWRRDEEDDQAQRLMWASAAVFLGRVLLLFAGLFYGSEPQQAASNLPPLEQAVNTATAALIVWSLAPRPIQWPRLLDLFLVTTLVLIGVMYLFFAQEWENQVNGGIAYYGGTTQAVIWTIIQIIVLVGGLAYLLLNSQRREPLPAIILGILLLAEVIHLWNYAEIIPTDTNVPYWIRLGYLITLPLWAIYAYQHALTPLLTSESIHKDSLIRFGSTLNQAAGIIATRQRERRIAKSLEMASNMLDAALVSLGFVDHRYPSRINFSSSMSNEDIAEIKHWAIDLTRHPTLNSALIQDQTVELLPAGLGARQLHEFYSSFGIDPLGPLLIHPLVNSGSHIGLLVIAAPEEQEHWTEDQKSLVPGLASYISQAVFNSQLPAVRLTAVPPAPEPRDVSDSVPSAIFLDQVRLSSLEAEQDELKSALAEAIERRKQAEEKALGIQKQARYLAAALRAAQESQQEQAVDQVQMDTVITENQKTTSHSEETTDS